MLLSFDLHVIILKSNQNIVKYFERKDDEVIEAKTIIETVERKYNIELSLPYMLFLIEIIENYFEVKVPMRWKFFLIRPR